MKRFLLGMLAAGLVAAGVVAYMTKPVPATVPASQQNQFVGAQASPDHYNYEQFYSGLGAAFYKTTSSGSSSSSPAALTSTASGHFVLAAAATTANASTTAVTASSDKVFLQQETTTPIAGTTCNTSTIATGTKVSLVVQSATSTNNGFIVTVPAAPLTNPYCYSYFIVK